MNRANVIAIADLPVQSGQIWQASCAALMTRAPVLSARLVAEHIKDVPA